MENKDKWLFVFAHSLLIKEYTAYASAFQSLGDNNKVLLFVHGGIDKSYALQFKEYNEVVDVLHGFNASIDDMKEGIQVFNKPIIELEKKIGHSFVWDDIRVDRYLRNLNNNNFIIDYLNFTFNKINELYQMYCPVLGYGESTMAIYRLIHRLFESENKLYVAAIGSRYFPRFYIEDTWNWEWKEAIKLYHQYLKDGLDTKTEKEIMPYYEKIVLQLAKPIAFEQFSEKYTKGYNGINFNFSEIKNILSRHSLNTNNKLEFKNNPRFSIVEQTLFSKLKRYLKNRSYNKGYQKLVTKKIPQDSKFAIYFLHYQPEYTVDSLGRFYMNQNYLIKNIAASLPADMLLLVKDHVPMIGLRPPSFYSDIVANKNVVLVNHSIDSLSLIKEAQIVFTIVGTVALEAMFMGKPSIMFGQYAFNTTNLITFCSNFWELPEKIKHQLALKFSPEDVRKHALALLAGKYNASLPGQLPTAAEQLDTYYMSTAYNLVKNGFTNYLKHNKIL